MSRLNVLLLIAVMVSAFYLVRTQYASRTLFVELDKAQAASRKLETENQQLEVDRRAESVPLRIQTLAQNQLHMGTANPAITQYVHYSGAAEPAAAASSASGVAR